MTASGKPRGASVGAIYGSVEIQGNSVDAIDLGVHSLLDELLGQPTGDEISCLLTSSADLNAAFPARSARLWGLGCPVFGLAAASGTRTIEVLIHVDTP